MSMNNLIQIAKEVDFKKVLNYLGIGITKSGQFCCPFHGDRTPSAVITDNNKGCCFVCNKVNGKHFSFDTIDLIMEVKGIDFKSAVNLLIELDGRKIDIIPIKAYGIKANESSSLEVKDMIKYCRVMRINQVEYLAKRGIYIPNNYDHNDYKNSKDILIKKNIEIYHSYYKNNGYKDIKDVLIKNNIAIYHNYYNNCNKIVYHFKHDENNCPYYEDLNEEFLIMKKTDKFDDINIPKAQNFGTPYPKFIFTNERELDVYICEGIEDALSMVQAGRNAVTLNSVKNVDKFIEILEDAPKLAKYNFIIATDMDNAGIECRDTLIEYFKEHGYNYDTFKALEMMYEAKGIHDVNDLWKMKLGLK